jgi:hypothetical protein
MCVPQLNKRKLSSPPDKKSKKHYTSTIWEMELHLKLHFLAKDNSLVVAVLTEKRATGPDVAGYVQGLAKLKDNDTYFSPQFDILSFDRTFLRKSHDDDTPKDRGFKVSSGLNARKWYWEGHVLSQNGCQHQNPDFFDTNPSSAPKKYQAMARALHEKCILALQKEDNEVKNRPNIPDSIRNAVKKYHKFDPKQHLSYPSKNSPVPVDHLLTDESLAAILRRAPKGDERNTDIYSELAADGEAHLWFSRHKNGRFSETAIVEFGYPNDTCPDLTTIQKKRGEVDESIQLIHHQQNMMQICKMVKQNLQDTEDFADKLHAVRALNSDYQPPESPEIAEAMIANWEERNDVTSSEDGHLD